MQKPAVPLFRGDTLRIVVRAVDFQTRMPVDLTGYEIEASVETPHGARVYDFEIAPAGADGLVVLTAGFATTARFPDGPLDCAIRLTSPAGDRLTSPTFSLSSDASLFS